MVALLDFFVTSRLFKLFPDATPSNVTFLRAQLVSNSTLAFLAIRVLEMHTVILHSSPDLQTAVMLAATQMEGVGYEAILQDMTWMTSPPKVLGDVVESLLGAILVDSGDLETVFGVLEKLVYVDVIPLLVNVERRDPISMMNRRRQEIHCSRLEVKFVHSHLYSSTSPHTDMLYDRAKREPESKLIEANCTFHDRIIATAHHEQSGHVARQLASRSALHYLNSEEGIEEIKKVCDCWEIVQEKSRIAKFKAEEKLLKELAEIEREREESMVVDAVGVEVRENGGASSGNLVVEEELSEESPERPLSDVSEALEETEDVKHTVGEED